MDYAYSQLMSKCTEGTYLYTPPKANVFHPGSCGLFDANGVWESITDLTALKEDNLLGLKLPKEGLVLTDPATCSWNKKVVEKNEGRGFGAKAEVSGIAAQAPVDVGANFAVGSTAKAGAGVVVSPNVVHTKFNLDAQRIIEKWIQDNMLQLTDRYQTSIERFGIWVITSTWVTEKCDIAMWNKTGSKIDTGAEIGATNIGKLGVNSSHEVQNDIDEHKVWDKWKQIQQPKAGALRILECSMPIKDKDGNYLDKDGNITRNGNGKRVDKDGNLVDEDGDRIDEDGNLIDEDGNIIPEWSTEVIGDV
ncbi:hypothetical protein J4E93_002131 [Alternaria ventricosa]|uniref:uncharacterized protein n=1 Tax=Alternaria ventricosa TaxID=1187951 RepID=UPI0020C44EC1|nr:uncharacterized protein J4E93_002131 [Alternaria ventricosa]KAI4651935.1 hypothetical protein J4E93_002131 [Alternaria ventricosa]